MSGVIAEAREVAASFLRAELEVAATLIAVAETTSNYATAFRNFGNAWRALRAAQEFGEKLDLDSTERQSFREMHAALCVRLANLRVRSQE